MDNLVLRIYHLSENLKKEYLALPIDHCFFDRTRYDKLYSELPTDILSFRKFDNGLLRVHFTTKEQTKGKESESREHLLWIHIIEIEEKKYVKYCCDCKYFDYRQLRVAKRLFGLQEIENDLVAVVDSKSFAENKKLFNIDKHAFIALKELFKIAIQISI